MVWLSLGSLLLGLLLLALASRVGAAPAENAHPSTGGVVTPFPRRSRSGAGATPFICRKCGAFLISVDGSGRAERTVRCTLCDQIAQIEPPVLHLDRTSSPERAASGARSFGTTLPVR